MPGNLHMVHLGTISYSLREFVIMFCIAGEHQGNCYIEEVVLNSIDWTNDVFANLKFIKEHNLAFDLAKFAEEEKLTDMALRMLELVSLK